MAKIFEKTQVKNISTYLNEVAGTLMMVGGEYGNSMKLLYAEMYEDSVYIELLDGNFQIRLTNSGESEGWGVDSIETKGEDYETIWKNPYK